MATTALDLLQTALEKLHVYAPGQTVNAADSARGLTQFQRMMDRWSNQPYACIANAEQNFALVPGKFTYSISASGGADVAIPRPLKILTGYGAASIIDANGIRYPVDVLEQDAWNQIATIFTSTSQIPQAIFYDPQFPLGIMWVYPIPSAAYTLVFDSRLPLQAVPLLTTPISLPPGYEAAIENNLCVELKPFFKNAQLDPDIKELARDSLADIKRTNMRPLIAEFDAAIVSRASPTYNIYNDDGA